MIASDCDMSQLSLSSLMCIDVAYLPESKAYIGVPQSRETAVGIKVKVRLLLHLGGGAVESGLEDIEHDVPRC
jgi:hypothetical protein